MVKAIEGCFEVVDRDPTDSFSHIFTVNAHRLGWVLSGVASLVATCISLYLIVKHSQYYYKPSQQRYIIRILLMIPIYSNISCLSYIFYREAPYYELIRDVYEAFVLSSFFILLVNYIGEHPEHHREALQQKQGERIKYPIPFNCFYMKPTNYHFLQYLKYGIMQYVVLRPLMTVLAIIMFANGAYCPENFKPDNGRVYIAAVNFASVSVAMYALIVFYIVMEKDLAPYKPFAKFLSVKLVIFFSFWQSVLIGVLAQFHIIKPTNYWTASNIRTGLEAIILCFEMVIFALIHIKAFPYRIYRPPARIKARWWWFGIVDALNPIDILREIWSGAVYLWKIVIRKEYPAPTSSKSPHGVTYKMATPKFKYDKDGKVVKHSTVLPESSREILCDVEEEEEEGDVEVDGGVIPSNQPGRIRYGGAMAVDLAQLAGVENSGPRKLEEGQ